MAADAPHRITDIAHPGVKVQPPALQELRREVAELLNRPSTSFPGAQPVSFARQHLQALRKEDYYVCEKSDGIRYLLYMTEDENGEVHYLIDRKNDFWFIENRNLHFPLQEADQAYHTNTIVDGELVMDKEKDGTRTPRFLVFDCLVLDGNNNLLAKHLDKRLGYFKQGVMEPYRNLFSRYPQEREFQAFLVEMKDMQFAYGIEMMFREVLPTLKHGNDGLIFTCRTSPYQHGTDPNILKWKPANENTIDFRLRLEFPIVDPDEQDLAAGLATPHVDYDSVPHAHLMVYRGSGPQPHAPFEHDLYLTDDEWEELKALGDPLNNRVVECGMDNGKRWRLHRFRDDKNEANHISTVNSVLSSIQDGVSEKELLEAAAAIKSAWKQRHQGDKAGQQGNQAGQQGNQAGHQGNQSGHQGHPSGHQGNQSGGGQAGRQPG